MVAGHPNYTMGGSDTVRVSAAVAKGQGVEADPSNAGKVRPWSAGSTTAVGVAQISGAPLSSNAENNMSPAREYITVQKAPVRTRVKFTAQATWRQPLVCSANGEVTPAGATPASGTVIGRCDSPDGVAAGAVGLVELYI